MAKSMPARSKKVPHDHSKDIETLLNFHNRPDMPTDDEAREYHAAHDYHSQFINARTSPEVYDQAMSALNATPYRQKVSSYAGALHDTFGNHPHPGVQKELRNLTRGLTTPDEALSGITDAILTHAAENTPKTCRVCTGPTQPVLTGSAMRGECTRCGAHT